MTITIERVYLEDRTVGSWYLGKDGAGCGIFLLCKTLELPWKDNKRSVSCIPEGEYKMVREAWTAKHPYPHFRILNVTGRSGILVHRITYVKHLLGCIGVGEFAYLDGDNLPDIASSSATLNKLYNSHDEIIDLCITKKADDRVPGK